MGGEKKMKKGLIGKKIGMTQIFNEEGKVIPVTVIEAGPCVVSQVKTEETDGYNSIQLGFGAIKESKVNKPERGHFTAPSTLWLPCPWTMPTPSRSGCWRSLTTTAIP